MEKLFYQENHVRQHNTREFAGIFFLLSVERFAGWFGRLGKYKGFWDFYSLLGLMGNGKKKCGFVGNHQLRNLESTLEYIW